MWTRLFFVEAIDDVAESDDELLPTIKDRFTYTDDLEEFLRDNGIEGKFWSRVGD